MKFLKSLKPPGRTPDVIVNPFSIMRSIDFTGWMLLLSGWLAWTMDGYDYFSVSLTAKRLSVQFGKSSTDITTAITLTLLFRSVGAVIFGVAADRYGRKWTLVINLLLIAIFELGSSFCNTYQQFLAVRSLFGIAMGGIWGLAASTSLENIPPNARGLVSGFLQQGYAVGYLIAAVVNLTLVPDNPHTWRALYWVGTGLSVFAAIFRSLLPESRSFLEAKLEAKSRGDTGTSPTRAFLKEAKAMLKTNWKRAIWAVCLMTGFNFLSHASQDLLPLFLQDNKLFSPHNTSLIAIISNCGAVVGGITAGYFSQYTGRRLAIIIMLVWTGAFIPLWILPSSFAGISAGVFFLQFGVQGAWGVVPIYLSESSPPAFRASFAGIAYQLGNMASAGSAQIEARGGENWRTTVQGKNVPDYAKVQGVLLGVIIGWTLIMTLLGPENHGSRFEQAVATREGAGKMRNEDLVENHRVLQDDNAETGEAYDVKAKGNVEHVEKGVV